MERAEAAEELRIATIGNVDAGKSTLVGCLTRDLLDDGRGKGRSVCFRHVHEQQTGRTSAIAVEIMGLDAAGGTLRTAETSRVRHFQAVRSQSKRIITFGASPRALIVRAARGARRAQACAEASSSAGRGGASAYDAAL